MRKLNQFWVLAVALLLLAPTSVLAQGASKDFPNDQPGAVNVAVGESGTLDIQAIFNRGIPLVSTGPIALGAGGVAGNVVAAAAFNAICAATIANPSYTCVDILAPLVNCTIPACCSVAPAGSLTIDCTYSSGGALNTWRLQKLAASVPPNVEVTPITPGFKLNALHHKTNAGNTVATDILPQLCVRVDRGSSPVNGVINFTVTGGPSAGSFSVDSTGKTDDALHREIGNGFRNLPGGGLATVLLPNAGGKCQFASAYQGPTVFLPNVHAKQVTRVSVEGVQGQIATAETSTSNNIPTLSEWGLILLAAILAISALWMLRRRSQTGSPA